MKTYRLLADSRQLRKIKGETVELPPAAAKYLVGAGVIEEVVPAAEPPARRKR